MKKHTVDSSYPLPGDHTRLHSVFEQQNNVSILQVLEQIVHINIREIEGINPHAEHSLLTTITCKKITQERKLRKGYLHNSIQTHQHHPP